MIGGRRWKPRRRRRAPSAMMSYRSHLRLPGQSRSRLSVANAKTHTALTGSGTYRGEIIGETDLHVIQRLSPGSAVAHMKHLLEPMPSVGDSVVVAYSNSKGTVKEFQQRGKAREMGR